MPIIRAWIERYPLEYSLGPPVKLINSHFTNLAKACLRANISDFIVDLLFNSRPKTANTVPVQKYATSEKSQTFCSTDQSSSPATANTAASAAAAVLSNAAKADEDFYLSYKMCPSVTASQSWPYELEFDKYVKKRNYCSNNSTTMTATSATTANRMTNGMISTTTSKASPNAKKQLPSSLSRATATGDTERVQGTQSSSSLKNILNLNTKSFPMKSLFLNNCNIVYNYDPAKQETCNNNKSGRPSLSSLAPPLPSYPYDLYNSVY